MKNQELLKEAINLHLSGKKTNAIEVYRKILISEPSNLIALNNLASLLNTINKYKDCLLYTSPSPRDATLSRMPSSA